MREGEPPLRGRRVHGQVRRGPGVRRWRRRRRRDLRPGSIAASTSRRPGKRAAAAVRRLTLLLQMRVRLRQRRPLGRARHSLPEDAARDAPSAQRSLDSQFCCRSSGWPHLRLPPAPPSCDKRAAVACGSAGDDDFAVVVAVPAASLRCRPVTAPSVSRCTSTGVPTRLSRCGRTPPAAATAAEAGEALCNAALTMCPDGLIAFWVWTRTRDTATGAVTPWVRVMNPPLPVPRRR